MKPENQPNELNKDLDIIIVGAGAAGAAAAWRLAAGGLKVACLERGDWQKDGDFPANKNEQYAQIHIAVVAPKARVRTRALDWIVVSII